MKLHTGLTEDSHMRGILLFTASIKKASLKGNFQPTSTMRQKQSVKWQNTCKRVLMQEQVPGNSV